MPQPVRLDRFMAAANRAYYTSRDYAADFVTAPELTQAFGEVVGAWAAVVWAQCGRPAPVVLVEAGPGRGTLMRHALGAVRRRPDFAAALTLHALEFEARCAPPFQFAHETLDALPAAPLILIGNEFLDALPVRQFVRRDGVWRERYVRDGALVELPGGIAGPPAPEGAVMERGEAAMAFTAALAARIRDHGGAALLIDYGGEGGEGDTLQALRHGRATDPLANPGEADLTAHVDWGSVAAAARAAGAAVWGPVPQGGFLDRLGLLARTEVLARADPSQAAALWAAARRLTADDAMGTLLKALAITRRGAPPPPGFEA